MGTRSLLGFELGNGKIHAQYLQFDGYPESKGVAYYTEILQGLSDFGEEDLSKNGKPTKVFFDRIRNYLNEVQYSSGHSVGNHRTVTHDEWYKLKLDWGQEWQYIFTRNGDFVFFSNSMDRYEVTIPWGFTLALLKQRDSKFMEAMKNRDFWGRLRFDDREENLKVLSWGADSALHVNEELEHESSKGILEKLLKGDKVESIDPVLTVNGGEAWAFKDQRDQGWRGYAFLTIGDKKISSMFSTVKSRRNEYSFSMTFRHVGNAEKARKHREMKMKRLMDRHLKNAEKAKAKK